MLGIPFNTFLGRTVIIGYVCLLGTQSLVATELTTAQADILLNRNKALSLINENQQTTQIVGNAGGATLLENVQNIKDETAPNLATMNATITAAQTAGNDQTGPVNITVGIPAPSDTLASFMRANLILQFRWFNSPQFLAGSTDTKSTAPLQSIGVVTGKNENNITIDEITRYILQIRAH